MSQENTEKDALRAERDMYRDKAHRAIKSLSAYDQKLGGLVQRLQDLIERVEKRADMSAGIGELRWVLGEDDAPRVCRNDCATETEPSKESK